MAGTARFVMSTLSTISEISEDQVCEKTLPETISPNQTPSEENELGTQNFNRCDPKPTKKCTFSDMIEVYHTSEPDTESTSTLVIWVAVFNWDDFCYALILGFLPTTWDVLSDLNFGDSLVSQGEDGMAGLCYLVICLPSIFMMIQWVIARICTKRFTYLTPIIHVIIGFAFAYAFMQEPLIFKYPACFLGLLQTLFKGVAIFVHTPEMKKFSIEVSLLEHSWESSIQLLINFFGWLKGGNLYISTMVSSILVIGKVSCENYLTKPEQEDRMKGESFLAKLCLVMRYLPLFSLVTFFRAGAGALKLTLSFTSIVEPFSNSSLNPSLTEELELKYGFRMWFVVFLTTFPTMVVIFLALRIVVPELKQLSAVEAFLGLTAECTTPACWGQLKRKQARILQLVMATYFLLENLAMITYLFWSHQDRPWDLSMEPWPTLRMDWPYQLFCICVATSGLVSYALLIVQFYAFPLAEKEPLAQTNVGAEEERRMEEAELQPKLQASPPAEATLGTETATLESQNERTNYGRVKKKYKRKDKERWNKKQRVNDKRKGEAQKEEPEKKKAMPESIEDFVKPKVARAEKDITVEEVEYMVLPQRQTDETEAKTNEFSHQQVVPTDSGRRQRKRGGGGGTHS